MHECCPYLFIVCAQVFASYLHNLHSGLLWFSIINSLFPSNFSRQEIWETLLLQSSQQSYTIRLVIHLKPL